MFNNHLFHKHLIRACLAAVFAIGLTACSSSNDQAGMEPPIEPDPMPTEPTTPPTANVMIPDQMYLNADNMPMAGTLSIMAGGTSTSGGVIFSCPAGGMNCEVTIAADGSATSTGGAATAALSDDAMMQVAQAKKAAQDAADAAAEVAMSRIIGKDRAIEGATNIADGTTTGTLDENDISITRAAGAMASVVVTDPAGYSASKETILPNSGWAARRLMRSVPGATQHLFVYTDIGPPSRIQFNNWDGDPDTPARYGTNDATAITTAAAMDLTTSLNALGSLDGNFNSPGSAADGDVTQTFRVASATATTVTRQGNFQGAPGTYTCTTAAGVDCVVTISPTGTYTATTGTWTFTPELGATAWLNDSEFLSFGWWLQEPANPDGAYTFMYYADGNAHTPAPGTLTTGTATYSGRAAGKFVVQEIDATGVTGGEAGMFTAAATLNATFGEAANANTISGSISGFASDNAAVDMSGWSVTLHGKTLADKAALANEFGATITEADPTRATYDGTTATLGDQTLYGNWIGQFFGDATTGNTGNAYPLGVGGTFQADNDAASIAGAFGARR